MNEFDLALRNIITQIGLNIQGDKGNLFIRRVTNDINAQVLNMVNYQSSLQINTIPGVLIGINNPVDLLTRNYGPQDIKSNLQGIISANIYSDIEKSIINSMSIHINDIFGPSSRISINFQSSISAITVLLGGVIHFLIDAALDNYTRDLFSGNNAPQQIISNISSQFSTFGSGALGNISFENSKNLANKYIGIANQFDSNNEDNLDKIVKAEQGFRDPESKYPSSEYAEDVDTNKLAQGDVENTIVIDKNKDRVVGAKLPGGDSFEQPESPYNAQYPHNKVIQTESGHVIEMDDTPGAERLHIYHKSGTFIEIDSLGSMVKRTKGSDYTLIDCNGKISIQGKADISVNGACNIYVGNDANIEVEGDTNLTCHNDINANAGGKFNMTAKEEINLVSTAINVQASEALNVKCKAYNIYSENINIKADNELNQQSVRLNIRNEEIRIESEENIHLKSGNNVYINPEKDLHLRMDGDYFLDADNYRTDDDLSRYASGSKDSATATDANAGTLEGRKHFIPVDINDPVPTTFKDNYSLLLEEPDYQDSEYNNVQNLLIKTGLINTDELVNTPEPLESFQGTSQQVIDVEGDQELISKTSLPYNYQLSPHFTLDMLSTNAAVSKYRIESKELTFGQIVHNLQKVALNVLEPVYGINPKLIVTSGYRSREKSSKTSQHPLGMAVDIQFAGMPKSEYYTFAKELIRVLNYDQFILEYSSYANNPWIHISYSGNNNRKQVLTFYNHRKKGDGLVRMI